jgi:hypothetical protein
MTQLRVEPTGVVEVARCDVKSAVCTANGIDKPVTVVLPVVGRRPVRVCGACLANMISSGEWEQIRVPPVL